jgi:hypothetical protein
MLLTFGSEMPKTELNTDFARSLKNCGTCSTVRHDYFTLLIQNDTSVEAFTGQKAVSLIKQQNCRTCSII